MQVRLRDGETFESLLRRFKVGMERSGVLRDFRQHQRFLSKSERARLKARKAARKQQKRLVRRAA